MDKETIIRSYDPQIARRLLGYLKPYRVLFFLALGALVLASLGELLTPVIIKRVMDEHILVSHVRIKPEAEEFPGAEPLFARPERLSGQIGEYLYLNESVLSEISGAVKRRLIDEELLDHRSWHWSQGEAAVTVMDRHPGLFERMDDRGALLKEALNSLPREDRRILREENHQGLKTYSLIFALLLLVILVFSFAQVYLMAYIAQGVMRDMRLGLLRHTMGLPLSSLSSRPVGSLVSRLTGDVETVNELFTSVATSLFRDFFMMFGVVAVLFSLNVRLAWITCLSLPPVLLLTWFFRARAREAYRKVRLWVSEVNGFLSERVAGMEIVQMFGREEASASLFGEKNRNLLKANLAEMYVFALFRPLIDLLTSVSIGVIVYFGARLFTDRALTLGILIAFINLIEKFYQPVKDLSEKFNILQSAMAGSERVFDLLDSGMPEGETGADGAVDAAVSTAAGDPKTEDFSGGGVGNPATDSAGEEKPSGDGLPSCGDGTVTFHGVEFSYNPEEPVLKGLSFTLHPGETVAVVGYTGAGKTTIANLMARFYEIQGGQICLGGQDIRQIPLDQLRRRVQTVQQEVFLFSGTLKENISLGKELTDQELRRALETVKADKFVDALPLGLDTPVKEGGVNFSAGQRQLISFARIIAHEPEIVILDEATASIDTETEKLIQEALATLLEDRTSLVIAHRLSTIQHADRIMVLNEGLLVEEGTHGELMARRGAYYNLYRLQYEKNRTL